MADTQDDNAIILNDLRAKIKTLGVAERKRAVALYGIFKTILEEVKHEEASNDAEYNKYNDKTATITTQMDDIVEGKRAVNEEELAFWKQEEPEYVAPADANAAAVLKGFWKGFLLNGDFYTGEFDGPILEHLVHIDAKTDVDEKDGNKKIMTLSFDFADNEFFENKNLWVKLHSDNDEAVRSEASEIKWKSNPTVEKTQKKQKNKRSGQTRIINKEVQKRSFFEIFNKYEAEDEEAEDRNADEENGTMNLFILEETVNDILDMMPYALEYFLDVRPDEDDEGKTIEEDDEEDNEDDDEEDGDDDDDDDDDEGRHKFKSRKSSEHQGKQKPTQGGKTDKDNPKQECKQQ